MEKCKQINHSGDFFQSSMKFHFLFQRYSYECTTPQTRSVNEIVLCSVLWGTIRSWSLLRKGSRFEIEFSIRMPDILNSWG